MRPYVEVWQGEHRMLSTLQEYDNMKLYMPQDNKVRRSWLLQEEDYLEMFF